MNRRNFLRGSALLGAGSMAYGMGTAPTLAKDWNSLAQKDLKPIARNKNNVFAVGKQGMVSSDHPLSTEAGLWALQRGGNAADAYMTAAIAQCVLEPTMTSLGGGFSLGYFDAGKGNFSMAVGSFGVPGALPLDIPYNEEQAWTGWSALLPGYLRGLESAHQAYGKLKWDELWEPAIAFAEGGFRMDHFLWGYSFKARKMLGRFEGSGRSDWFNDGHMIGVGDVLRQPELAATMKMLQREGADAFYEGKFARRLVETVNKYGGEFTLEDMAKVKGYVSPGAVPGPQLGCGKYRGYDIGTMGGGLNILATRLMERADLGSMGHPSESADSLYIMARIVQEMWAMDSGRFSMDGDPLKNTVEMHQRLISDEMVEQVWKEIQQGKPKPFPGFAAGTCALTVVDSQGNVANGTHSTSSESYGSGIWVDGVIINRPVFLRKFKNMPAGITTAQWVFKDGKPVYAMATPSRSFLECVLQATANTFEFDMGLEDSAYAKRFGHPHPGMQGIEIEGDIDWAIQKELMRRGIEQFPVSPMDFNMGSIHAVYIQPDGAIHGVADPRRAGMAKGY